MLLSFSSFVYVIAPAMALQGIGRSIPYAEAESLTRTAAQSVLAKSGSEDCLRGKLTNALLDLSKSCNVEGVSSSLCVLADQVASREDEFTFGDMTRTSTALLQLLNENVGQR